MFSIGIMQGRLTPPKGRGIQFFPFDNWEKEFYQVRDLGLQEIDFIFDYPDYEQNPLWTSEGIERINSLISETGIRVRHVCADFFMARPFFRVSEESRRKNIEILNKLIENSHAIGAENIEIPLVDNSSIKTDREQELLIKSVRDSLSVAQKFGIHISLETDLPSQPFLLLLKQLDHPLIKASYDSGNSASFGYDPEEEMNTYGSYVFNIHIKDRLLHGKTVDLGTGNTDFERLFQQLRKIEYRGSFILQPARGKEGEEAETIENYTVFLKNLIVKFFTS